jgi:hypothetical protein
LEKQGIGLAGTGWLKPLKDGLYEFRVRSTAAEIVRRYADAGHVSPDDTETILLRDQRGVAGAQQLPSGMSAAQRVDCLEFHPTSPSRRLRGSVGIGADTR